MNRVRAFQLVCVTACLGFAVHGVAQQGYPLSGTWSGDWGSSVAQRNQITLVMDWDGKRVTGLINPGPNSLPLTAVALDVTNWGVKIEAAGIMAEGRLDDIGSYHRTIRGTWRQGGASGDFKLTRN